MSYSVTLLNTAAECDALIESLNADKEALAFRKISMDRQRKAYQSSSISIGAELQAVAAEIAALTSIIGGLADGPLKDENVKRLRKAELKKFLLEDRQKGFGVMALIDREVEVTRADLQIAEIDTAISAVETRKTGL